MKRVQSTLMALLCCLCAQSAPAQESAQHLISVRGLVSLTALGRELIANDRDDHGLILRSVTLQSPDGARRPADLQTIQRKLVTSNSITMEATWGRVQTTFSAPNNRDIHIETQVTNTGPDIIRGFTLQLATLRFPGVPPGFNGDPRLTHNRDGLAIIRADVGDLKVLLTNDLPGRAVLFGLPYSIDKPANKTYPLILSTQQVGWLQGPNLLDPYLERPIYPGQSDTFRVSIRFGDNSADDLKKQYAAMYPMKLNWPDRRSIGMIHLSSSEKQFKENGNLRGWFQDKSVDVSTEAGRADFKKRVLQRADESIRILKAMDSQGAIVWDLEGQEFPHATSYLGDPRSLPPEIEPIADEFFKKFRNAGLKIGVTIRPQMPIRAAYGNGVQQSETVDPAQTMIDKIAYAKKRWNCTLFYVDSNGDPNVPFDAALFAKVLSAHGDVLLLPEHQATRYWAYSAPYDELRGGVTGTPQSVREIYPNAFSVIIVSDGPIDEKRTELVKSVKAGDVLMFRAWFDDSFNAKVKSIYDEAKTTRKE